MNNAFIQTLATLVARYFNDLKAGGVECRLVIPALTPEIGVLLHEALLAIDLPSYLVVPASRQPDARTRWIRAEGVTSVRQGEMVVVVWPGEMSRIQDSVIGVGGAMRNFAFSDEWPWVDTSNEYFQFNGPVLKCLLEHWAIEMPQLKAYERIILAALDASHDSMVRGNVFLDSMLGAFDPSSPSELDPIERLLFHFGIPRPTSLDFDDADAVSQYFKNVRALTRELEVRLKEVDGRNELLSRIEEDTPDRGTAEQLRDSLGALFDGFTIRGDDKQQGLLSIRGCWPGLKGWQTWDLQSLLAVLDVPSQREKIEVAVEASTETGVVSANGKTLILLEGGSVRLRISYKGLAIDASPARIVVVDRKDEIFSTDCITQSGVEELEIFYDRLFGGTGTSRKRSLKIGIERRGDLLATARLSVNPCNSNQPLVTLIEPTGKVLVGTDSGGQYDQGDSSESIEVNEPVAMTVVSWDSFLEGEIDVDGVAVALEPVGQDTRILRLASILDPGINGLGRTSVALRASGLEILFDLEANEVSRGEFTLERELLQQLARFQREGKSNALRRIVDVFLGKTKDGYSGLGGLDDASRSRLRLARIFENDDSGRPIVTNLMSERRQTSSREENSLFVADDIAIPDVLRDSTLGPQTQQLVLEYGNARAAVLRVVRSGMLAHPQWPDYAYMPVFNEAKRVELEAALSAYLKVYLSALQFVRANVARLSLAELFRILYADCVIHWGGDEASRKVLLLGPWHPATVAKRFMVQAALVSSARRHMSTPSKGKSQVLAMLLDQVNSLRWFSGVAEDGKTFESFYISATTDPGWSIAVSHAIIGGQRYFSVVETLRRVHGLETGIVPASRELVARGYLRDFFNAYPTRRAISVVADSSYEPARLSESARAILYDGDQVTDLGRQLPGGIHIIVPDASRLDDQDWRVPPVCLYENADASGPSTRFKDINLISPGSASTTRDPGGHSTMPRGAGDLAAFCWPVRAVSLSADSILHSRAFERDVGDRDDATLGDVFSVVCQVLAALPNDERVVSWQANLPPSLSHLWTIIPGNHVDPAVFVRYVSESAKKGDNTALWDYSMSLTGAINSYFVLSKIPASICHELNRSPVLQGKPLAPNVLSELGRVGMALGGESLRSGSKALGVIGVVAAVRLFLPPVGDSPMRNANGTRGFLLPVDSFRELLGGSLDDLEAGPRRRADLVAMQLGIVDEGMLGISACAIECKYSSNPFSGDQTLAAIDQAEATSRRLEELIAIARRPDGVPERLALVALISFGLRLSKELASDSPGQQAETEAKLLKLLLDGKFKLVPPRASNVVVITDCTASNPSFVLGRALVVMLAPGHWPGVSESPSLLDIRGKLAEHFSTLFAAADSKIKDAVDGDTDRRDPSTSSSGVKLRNTDADSSDLTDSSNTSQVSSQIALPGELPSVAGLGLEGGAPVPINRLARILLGTAEGEKYFYDPQNNERPLDNYNVMITGSSGKGKTQLIKTLVCRLRQQQRSVLLLDFKNDFASDEHFIATAGLHGHYVTFDGLPFNPLIPIPLRRPNSDTEYLPISEHINGLVDILRGTFGLGDQQEAAVKNAIREAFQDRGIAPRGSVPVTADIDFPDFNEVGEKLARSNPNAYNRLDPLFDLGIFPAASRLKRFDEMLRNSSVVDLSKIQADRIKNAVAKILIMSAHRFYNAREHSGILRQFFVFDEAHRVLDSDFVLQFVRECRAYGVGVLLSSQYPSDFPPDVSASLNTKFIHGNDADKARVRDIAKLVGGALPEDQIERLSMFRAIISNPQYSPAIVRTIGYPMMLVLDAIRGSGEVLRRELVVAGVNPQQLDLDYLLAALLEMGLVEETQSGLRVTKG